MTARRPDFQRADELFDACCELEDRARDAFLDEACGGDHVLRDLVEQMLDFDRERPEFLAGPVMEAFSGCRALPRAIGPFRILQLLGEGGMGTVYEAEQDRPRRTVALKVLRTVFATNDALRRFEQEGEVLGRLQHPGIAQIFESGRVQTETGPLPYFAMEFVQGEPLTVWARNRKLDETARLELFARVCDAVQHAHQQGVIHRDLKPENILVDSSGRPRILDFGIARLSERDVQLTTLRTDVGQILGTLSYMSPEQAAGDPRAIDTRSDVYSLGVLLYELLTDRLPYDVTRKALPEAVRTIREQDPTPISQHGTLKRGDVQTIVATALKKDKDRRYASAAALADDVLRYLRDEPIAAHPASRMYMLVKFGRRNKTLVTAAAAVVVALVAGLVVALWFGMSEAEQRRVAVRKTREAERQLYRASIALALRALEEGNSTSAREFLDAAPEELRNWEWKHLSRRLGSLLSETGVPRLREAALVSDERVVTVDDDGVVRVWDALMHQTGAARTERSGRVPLTLTEDGRWLMSWSPGSLFLRDLNRPESEGHEIEFPYGRPRRQLHGSAVAPDGSSAVVSTQDDEIVLVEWSEGGSTQELQRLADCHLVRFSPDGRRVALGAHRAVAVWDLESRESWSLEQPVTCYGLAFDSEGQTLTVGAGTTILVLDAASGETRATWGTDSFPGEDLGYLIHLDYSPDQRYLALTFRFGAVRVVDVDKRERVLSLEHAGDNQTRATFGADGTTLLTTSRADDRLRLWGTGLAGPGTVLRGHESFVYPVAFHPRGEWIASGSWDGSVRLWDASTGEGFATLGLEEGAKVKALAFSPDGMCLCVGHHLGLDVRTLATGAAVKRAGSVWALDYRPDGDLLAVGEGWSGGVGFLDPGSLERARPSLGRSTRAVAFHPDGHLLAVGTDTAELLLIDPDHGSTVALFEGVPGGHRDYRGAQALDFSPDGGRLAVGWGNGTVTIHEVPSLQDPRVLHGHVNEVFSVAWSPDGTRLATGGRDGQLHLWESDGRPLVTLDGHTEYIYSLAFSPDGRWIVTGSGDGTVRIWDSDPLAVRWRARGRASRLRARAERIVAEHGAKPGLGAWLEELARDEGSDPSLLRLARQIVLRRVNAEGRPPVVGHGIH